MSKLKPLPVTLEAVAVFRTDHILHESVRLKIVDGIVTSVEYLTRGPDMASTAVGQADRCLWSTIANNVPLNRGDLAKAKATAEVAKTV